MSQQIQVASVPVTNPQTQQAAPITVVNPQAKVQTTNNHNTSSIPCLPSPVIPEKQTLPALNLPRKSLNLSLPQNYHAYKSQSESPFSMRNKSHTQKNYLNNNSIKLDKIEETSQTNFKSKIVHRQNRSISPSINEKAQIKNTLNLSNLRNQNKNLRQQTNGESNQKNPIILNQSQRLKMQTLQGDSKTSSQKQMSNTLKSQQSNTPQSQQLQNSSAVNPSYQKQNPFTNQKLQGSQVVLVPKSQQAAVSPQQNDTKLAALVKKPLPQIQQSNSSQGNNNVSQPDNLLKFYVGGGNNGERIRKLMLKREGWVETKDPTTMFVNFKWQQTTRGYKYEKLVENTSYKQVVNHFEFHKEITNKQYLVKNLMSFAESMKQNVFDITPLTYVIDFNDENCDLILNNFLKFFEMNMPTQVKKKQQNLMQKQADIRKILRQFQTQYGQQGTEKLFNYFYTRWSLHDTFLDKNNSTYMWLLKPTFLNRGRGIHVFNSLASLEKLMTDYTEGFEEKSLKKQEKKEEGEEKNDTQEIPIKESQNNNKKLSQSQPNIIIENQIKITNQPEEQNLEKMDNKSSMSLQKLPSPERKVDGGLEETKENDDKVNNQINSAKQLDKENNPNQSHSPDVKKISQNGNNFQIKKIKPLQNNRANNNSQKSMSINSGASTTSNSNTNASLNSQSMVQSVPVSTNSNRQSKKEKEKEKEKEDPNKYIRAQPQGPYILKASQFVIQKYIEKPLLINKRKFDIRVWALVTQNLDVYFFREGYMRLSSSEFSTDERQLDNLFIHLTNNAIQKYSDNYGQFENGNMWSFQQLWEFLEANYQNNSSTQTSTTNNSSNEEKMPQKFFKKKIVSKIKDIIWLTFCSVKKKINQNDRKFCFEIFGFDFLIDEELNSWLIEVNTNPAIDECSQLLKTLIPRALDDALKLTIDQIFSKRQVPPQNTNVQNKNKEKSPTHQPQKSNSDNENDKIVQDQIIEKPVELEEEDEEEEEEGEKKISSVEQIDLNSPIKQLSDSPQQASKSQSQTNNGASQEPSSYPVPGYEDTFNMWELLGNLKDSSNVQVKKKFKQLK
ncbi:hypothetical protein ABPG74_002209 [Tetrahymena malaccensis]